MDRKTDQKREYTPPQIRSEEIEIGVFGNYGGGGSDDWCLRRNPPVAFFNPFFHFCCS